MKLSKGSKTREKVIQVATRHFFQLGLYEVTYQGIAAEIGITQPAIYKYFKNMDELFLECCKYWDERARSTIYANSESLLSAPAQLKAYVELHFVYTQKNRSHDSLVFGLYYYSMRSSKMLKYYKELRTKAVSNLANILQFGNVDRSWKIKTPVKTAETVHSLMAGEIFKFLIDPKEESVERRTRRVLKAIQSIISE